MKLWPSLRQFDPEVRTQTILNAGNTNGLPTTVLDVEHRIAEIWTVQFGGKLEQSVSTQTAPVSDRLGAAQDTWQLTEVVVSCGDITPNAPSPGDTNSPI